MKELNFPVDKVVVTSKLIDGKTEFTLINDEEKDLKLVLKATFKKDVPTDWGQIFGREGDIVRIEIASLNRQSTLEE